MFLLPPVTSPQKAEARELSLIVPEEVSLPQEVAVPPVLNRGLRLGEVFHGQDVSCSNTPSLVEGRRELREGHVNQDSPGQNEIKCGILEREVVYLSGENVGSRVQCPRKSARMRIRFNADDLDLLADESRQGEKIVTAIAPYFEDPTQSEAPQHLPEQRRPGPPVDDVPVGVFVAEPTPPFVELSVRSVALRSIHQSSAQRRVTRSDSI